MPMYLDQLNLELDAVEQQGAGRVPQEMAKSGRSGGLNPHPDGIHPNLSRHQRQRTHRAIGAEITQVMRREINTGKERK